MKVAIPVSLIILILAVTGSAFWRARARDRNVRFLARSAVSRRPSDGWTAENRRSDRLTYNRARNRNTVATFSMDSEHYTVKLDQCFFNFYDLNNDGLISKEEMYAIFGENTSAAELFEALDITTGDGQISEEEFNSMAEVTIDGCQPPEEK